MTHQERMTAVKPHMVAVYEAFKACSVDSGLSMYLTWFGVISVAGALKPLRSGAIKHLAVAEKPLDMLNIIEALAAIEEMLIESVEGMSCLLGEALDDLQATTMSFCEPHEIIEVKPKC